jgi:hypothetical protein
MAGLTWKARASRARLDQSSRNRNKQKSTNFRQEPHLVFYVSKPLNWPPQYNLEAVRYRVTVHWAHTA